MKRMILLAVILLSLTGCMFAPLVNQQLDTIKVISATGYIYRPLMNGGDDWTVHPGNKEVMDWSTGLDRYGNKTGLSDDEVWKIDEVHIKLDEKNEKDTIFWPRNLGENECVWFPGWTAQMELISGLPYPMYPLTGYPWDACQTRTIPVMPSQIATITASARTDWIEVEITLPERSDGQYTLDLPGYTPKSSNVLTTRLSGPCEIIAAWTDGTREESWLFVVPVDWFWINGSWEIPVGPSGVCG